METRGSSPRANHSCSVKDQRNKEKSDRQPNTNWQNDFYVLKSARSPVAAHTCLLIVALFTAREQAPIIVAVIVIVAVSLSTANRLVVGNAELLRKYRNLP